MQPVRLAYLGPAHSASPWLLEALTRVGRFEALCDAHAERDAERWHARWTFADVGAMLQEAELDGVIIGAPFARRAGLVKECLAGGAGVLTVGAPGTVRDCSRFHSLGKVSGHCVVAAPALRYSPSIKLARRLIESGKVGRPTAITLSSTWRGGVRDVEPHGASVSVDQVFEVVDIVHYLLGELNTVQSLMHGDGVLAAQGVTQEGALVSLTCHACGPPDAVGLDIDLRAGDGSRLLVDRNGRLVCGNGSRVDATHGPSLAAVAPCIELGYEGLLAEFVRRLSSDQGGLPGGTEEVVRMTHQILRTPQRRGRGKSALADEQEETTSLSADPLLGPP